MFKLQSNYKPTGDQPTAIEYLSNRNIRGQEVSNSTWCNSVLGKTFTMANIINKVQRPTLVLAHNKTLARTTLFRIQRVFSRK